MEPGNSESCTVGYILVPNEILQQAIDHYPIAVGILPSNSCNICNNATGPCCEHLSTKLRITGHIAGTEILGNMATRPWYDNLGLFLDSDAAAQYQSLRSQGPEPEPEIATGTGAFNMESLAPPASPSEAEAAGVKSDAVKWMGHPVQDAPGPVNAGPNIFHEDKSAEAELTPAHGHGARTITPDPEAVALIDPEIELSRLHLNTEPVDQAEESFHIGAGSSRSPNPKPTQANSRRQKKKTRTQAQGGPPSDGCSFCFSNRESARVYTSHAVRVNGITTCPVLRKFVCPRCGGTGDNSHSVRYCPEGGSSHNYKKAVNACGENPYLLRY